MKNKTIAFVSDAVYPYNKGGKEKRIFEISTRLVKEGYTVRIYTMNWWNNEKNHIKENGVHLHAISPLYPLYSGERRSIRQAVLFSLACFTLLNKDFDVIEVDHMPHLVLFPLKFVTLLKRKKLYATWNEVWGRTYWKKYLGRLGNIAFIIEWLSARMPDEIIAVSEHTKSKLEKDLKIKHEIKVIPNGIDFAIINNVKPAKEKSDVIFAGRLLSHKNVNLLIASIQLLKNNFPNIKCVIVGKGPEEHKLKDLVEQLQLQDNIIFYNFLEKNTDLYALMKSSKVFAFPSTREGFGIAALEANASGLPVITTNHQDNATRDLIINGLNGATIQLDEKQLAEKVKNYLILGTRSEDFTTAAKNYDWNTITKLVLKTYNI